MHCVMWVVPTVLPFTSGYGASGVQLALAVVKLIWEPTVVTPGKLVNPAIITSDLSPAAPMTPPLASKTGRL